MIEPFIYPTKALLAPSEVFIASRKNVMKGGHNAAL
jgi:hypothetical protein